MIYYYYNPKTQDLILFNTEEKEIFIIEKIKNIKVFIGEEIEMGDDGKRNKPILKKKVASGKKKWKLTPETIAEIKRLKSEMKSIREIAEKLGISQMSVWKYSKK